MNPADFDNEIWMHKFKTGEETALKDVFKLYGSPLYFFAHDLIDNRQQAEDIVAESFAKLWRQRKTFAELRNIKAYLYIVTRNACLDYLKHVKRKTSSHRELRYILKEGNDEVLNKIMYADLLKVVFTEMENLPDLAKKIFKMTFIEGLKPEEIAEKLDMPSQNVRNNKNRAIVLLKGLLIRKGALVSLRGD